MINRRIKTNKINSFMPEIFTIDLSKQELQEIPIKTIRSDANWLILSDNKIQAIPKEIRSFKHVSRLALNDNRIETIDPSIGECIGISWIDLTRNKLKSLPNEFRYLTRISGLGLSENHFEEIPECIYELRNLRKFGFFSNKIKMISSDIRNLKSLVKLDLSNNKIESLPIEFCELTNLSWLNLSNNKLTKIPPQFNNLKKLEELGLGMNELEEIPNLCNLNNLRILPLFKNKLKKVHPSLYQLRSLEKLDLSDNEITEFPYDALYNRSLRYLNLRNNRIEYISPFEMIDTLSTITLIDLSENRLKFIPYKFFKLFSQSTTIRLGANPYEKKNYTLSTEQSLLQICFTKIINEKNKVDPWVNKIFKAKHVCDFCLCQFVVEPCFAYNISYLDSEHQFVVEKMLCSMRCLRKCEE